MGTITAQSIITRARKLFHDDTGVRWPDQECLDWLNDGQREIVLLKPNAYSVNAVVQLVPGTKQSIPQTGIQLIDIVRNMTGVAPNFTTPGKVVRLVDREVLDSTIPTWHSSPAAADGQVDHYVFDGRDPKTFYVYPQAPATPNAVEMIYSAAPANVATITGTITLDDIYANALLDYIMYRSYSKDAEFAANENRAAGYYQAFLNSLGLKTKSEQSVNPNNVSPGAIVVPDQG